MNKDFFDKRQKIWVLEDDSGCRFVYKEILDHRYDIDFFETFAEFQNSFENDTVERPDLIIADLKLPDMNFLTFLASDNAFPLSAKFIVVSSVDDIDALRLCFEEGALEYLTKPFGRSELILKLERIFQKMNEEKMSSFEIPEEKRDEKSLNPFEDEVFKSLTQKEQQVYYIFLNSKNNTVSRETILKNVWKNVNVHPKTLDVHIYNLRRKLKNKGIKIVMNPNGEWTLLRDGVNE